MDGRSWIAAFPIPLSFQSFLSRRVQTWILGSWACQNQYTSTITTFRSHCKGPKMQSGTKSQAKWLIFLGRFWGSWACQNQIHKHNNNFLCSLQRPKYAIRNRITSEMTPFVIILGDVFFPIIDPDFWAFSTFFWHFFWNSRDSIYFRMTIYTHNICMCVYINTVYNIECSIYTIYKYI